MEQRRRPGRLRRLACVLVTTLFLGCPVTGPSAALAHGGAAGTPPGSAAPAAPAPARTLSPAGLAVVEYDPAEAPAFPVSPEAVAAWAEDTVRLLQAMGYRHPEPPARITLIFLGDRLYGRFTAAGGIGLNPHGPDPLKTLDHELFHWVQQAYPEALGAGAWWLEATAEWFALFRPGVGRAPALRYGERLNAGLTSPLVSPYPAALFVARLAHRHGADLVRRAMELGAAGPDEMIGNLETLVGRAAFRDELFTLLLQAWLRDTDGPSAGDPFEPAPEPVMIARGAGRVEPLSADVLLVRLDPARAAGGPLGIELAWEPPADPGAARLWVARFGPELGVSVTPLPPGTRLTVDPAGATAVAVGVASLSPGHAPLAVRLAGVTWAGGRVEGPAGPAPGRAESRATYMAAWSDRAPAPPGTPPRPTDPALWTAAPAPGTAMSAAEWPAGEVGRLYVARGTAVTGRPKVTAALAGRR